MIEAGTYNLQASPCILILISYEKSLFLKKTLIRFFWMVTLGGSFFSWTTQLVLIHSNILLSFKGFLDYMTDKSVASVYFLPPLIIAQSLRHQRAFISFWAFAVNKIYGLFLSPLHL